MQEQATTSRLPREERERRVLDAASELFYARGVHEVGMDELIRATGLGKATVYRLFRSKGELIGAYLRRRSGRLLDLIDADVERNAGDPAAAVRSIFAAVAEELRRPGFRGCAFHNASVEFADASHPARLAARHYREALRDRLAELAAHLDPEDGDRLGARLALVLDGMFTSAAHLGPDGPAAAGPGLVDDLLKATRD